MTTEEAEKILQLHYEFWGFETHIGEALKIAYEALKKETPKEPVDHFTCPNCRSREFGYLRPRYCDHCGQRIKEWKDD